MFDFLSHDFMKYAFILAITLVLSSSLLSSFLVLTHQSMIADGTSHIAFTGIIIGLLFFKQPIYIAIPFTVISGLLITYLGQIKMINHDSAIGVVSAFSLAVGLILVSKVSNFQGDIETLLTGFLLSASLSDVVISIVILVFIALFVLIFYRPLLLLTYDEVYAKFSKINYNLLKYLLSMFTSLFIVVGIRTVGMLLISTFIIFPSLIASQLSKSFKNNIILSIIISLFVVLIAFIISYNIDTPTGSTIVITYTFTLLIFILIRKLKYLKV